MKIKSRTLHKQRFEGYQYALNSLMRLGVQRIDNVPIYNVPIKKILNRYLSMIDDNYFNDYTKLPKYLQREYEYADGLFVYFFANIEMGFCKIGCSKNVYERIKSINCSTPYEVKIISVIRGNYKLEKELHDKFSEYRLNGEWFKYDGKLKQEIEKGFIKQKNIFINNSILPI